MKLGYLGQEITILDPDGFQIVPFEIARVDRTASGRLVKDIIAIKNRFILQYDALDPDDIDTFIQLFTTGRALNFIYEDSGKEKEAKVYITNFPRELFIYDWRYSENITITLEEI